jgi:plasmid stabilization system protein ParE
MRVRVSRRALADAKRKKSWWQRNRPEAADLFEQELGAAIERIAAAPALGQRVEQRGKDVWVRRYLMPRTGNHVYYAAGTTEIVVLTVWGAARRQGPKV